MKSTVKQEDDLVTHVFSNNVLSSGKPKANVVVPIGRPVPVTDGRTNVPAVIVPGAAANNMVIAF